MATNKQCPYRSQEHTCKQPERFEHLSFSMEWCALCLKGQIADNIELVASAIMEKSIDKLEDEIK